MTEEGYDNSSAKMVKKGDILLALYGANSGDISISQIQGAINQAILCIRTDVAPVFFKSVWEKHVQRVLNTYLQGGQGNLSAEIVKSIPLFIPSSLEQEKLAGLFSHLEERIAVQNKIIEDLLSIKESATRYLLSHKEENYRNVTLGDITEIITRRNKNRINYPMYSVTNDKGFIPQTEQFEEREMVSDDISAYKIIQKDEIAYNPARINVGSIAQYTEQNPCMISSLYVCIKAREGVDSRWLIQVLKSEQFINYYNLYAEGGVRLYLFYPNFSRIKVALPPLARQQQISKTLDAIDQKIKLESSVLSGYRHCKQALLDGLFL